MKTAFLVACALLVPCVAQAQQVPAQPVGAATPALAGAAKATCAADQLLLDKATQTATSLVALSLAQGGKDGTGTKALLEARRCLDKVSALLTAPPTLAAGEAPRRSNLILDSLAATRVWIETARKEAPATLNTQFDQTLRQLKGAEQEAALRVEVQNQPHPKSDEELLAEGDRTAAITARELPILEKELRESRQRHEEAKVKLHQLLEAAHALPAVTLPTPEQQQKEQQEMDAEVAKYQARSVINKATLAWLDASQKSDRLFTAWLAQQQQTQAIKEELRTSKDLTPDARQKLQQKLAQAKADETKAKENLSKAQQEGKTAFEYKKRLQTPNPNPQVPAEDEKHPAKTKA